MTVTTMRSVDCESRETERNFRSLGYDDSTLAATLEASGAYRVIEKYSKPDCYCLDDGSPKLLGIFLDIETTGLDYARDKIIKLSMVAFTFSKDGRIFQVVDEFDQFEDPEIPIPNEISALTGITDDQVRGQKINPIVVERFGGKANLIIAHNAAFDRPFVEDAFPIFQRKPWACSMREVPWQPEGIESCKLEYVAYRCGFFFEGHRAIMDCLAGVHILAKRLPQSGAFVLEKLLHAARKDSYRIWAIDAPYEKKDELRQRGYRWNDGSNGQPRSWSIEVFEEKLLEEEAFLAREIYSAKPGLRVEKLNAFCRYSIRR
jgi:DNA polymerase III subunit epsilon